LAKAKAKANAYELFMGLWQFAELKYQNVSPNYDGIEQHGNLSLPVMDIMR
jgi:hypothetical protein